MKESALSRNPGISVNAQPKPDPASERVIYEQPLSERIRSFLRLEHLFERAQFQLNSGDPWSSRNTLECIIAVQSVLSRADLKKELINELERYATRLESLSRNPNVDQGRLTEILDKIRNVLQTLRRFDNVIGHELRYNELLVPQAGYHSSVGYGPNGPSGMPGNVAPANGHGNAQRPVRWVGRVHRGLHR